jgi:Rrf2 family transcriptional regulator, cysteine metabolism repressor
LLAITSKSPYAVRALCELALCGASVPIPIGELARRRDIPQQFLEGVFATLRRAGILQSQRGVKGGYLFARSPSDVTVLEVVELLEGELSARDSNEDEIWPAAVAALREVLAKTTIADLAEREARAKGQSMYYI